MFKPRWQKASALTLLDQFRIHFDASVDADADNDIWCLRMVQLKPIYYFQALMRTSTMKLGVNTHLAWNL